MKEYKINEEELCGLLKQAYHSGYEGYRDMASSAAQKIARKFLKGKLELVEAVNAQSGLVLSGTDGQHWRVEPESEVTLVGDDVQITFPDTTLNSWYSIGNQEE